MSNLKKENLRSVLLLALHVSTQALTDYKAREADRQSELGIRHCQEDIDKVWQAAQDYNIILS